MSSGIGERQKRRTYRPAVEALEALRLLSHAAQMLPGMPVAFDAASGAAAPALDSPAFAGSTWDTALDQTRLTELLAPARTVALARTDPADVSDGLSQLNRYLNRAWYRAGVPVQQHDDCTQAVYVTLLQNLGSGRFNSMLADIGRNGVRDVLSRETPEGPDFFRAIDTVKKRAQREKAFQTLDAIEPPTDPAGDTQAAQRGALQEAIARTLNPREASLIQETLMGKTPAEIAAQWGVAPKTVSNEKTRVLQKLRGALVADQAD